MKREEVLKLLATAENDINVWEYCDGFRILVIVYDFEGFDDDWEEIYRDYDEELVDSIQEKLKKSAVSVDDDGLYTLYTFNDFVVEWGYSSFDI